MTRRREWSLVTSLRNGMGLTLMCAMSTVGQGRLRDVMVTPMRRLSEAVLDTRRWLRDDTRGGLVCCSIRIW